MGWFNTYADDEARSLTRRVVTEADLTSLPLTEWTDDELGLRLAVLYPQVDGYEHKTAPDEVKVEIRSLMTEIERRGYDPASNLIFNERNSGWGWLPGFWKRKDCVE